MSVPSFVDTDFVVTELLGVTDWATVVTAIDTVLTSDLPVASRWTSLGGGEYESPHQDSAGVNRFFGVVVTRISATRFELAVKDKFGTTFHTGTIDLGSPAAVKIYAGPYHFAVQSIYAGPTREVAYAFMTDPAPFGLGQSSTFVYAWTKRNSAGTLYGTANQFGAGALVASDQGGTTPRSRSLLYYMNGIGLTNAGDPSGYSAAGSTLAMPYEISTSFAAANQKWAGRGYQLVVLPSNLTFGTVVTVPLDTGVSGDFEVLGINQPSNGIGSLGIRVA